MEDQYITIPAERYVDLLRAEHTTLMMLSVIKERKEHYCGISLDEVKLLHNLFFGYVGEKE